MKLRTMFGTMVACGAVLVAGCASASGGGQDAQQVDDPNAPQACVIINNRQGGGPAERVFLLTSTRERMRIGNVPMGREERYCFRRTVISGEYQILVERPSSDRLDPADGTAGYMSGQGSYANQVKPQRSQIFTLKEGWVVSWDARLNQIKLLSSDGAGGP